MEPPSSSSRSPSRMALVRPMRWQVGWADLVVLIFVGMLLYGMVKVGREWRAPSRPVVTIDLSLRALPLYTFYSLCRGLAAFALSLLFTLVYGYTAARVRFADKVMLPLLDILQSIPVLGFMPGVILALAALFPNTNVGLELAAVLMIFTGQVWNMTFSFYHSLRGVPADLTEVGRVYHFGWWRRLTRIELPSAAVGLVWNGMMSMAGGWFFLTINEAFHLGDRDFRLPGVGAYMSVAIDRGDRRAMIAAVVAMTMMILIVDQLLWRPLVAWADRFKLEDVAGTSEHHSWVLDLLRRSRLYPQLLEALRQPRARRRAPARPLASAGGRRRLGRAALLGLAGLVVVSLLLTSFAGTIKLIAVLARLDGRQWMATLRAGGLTLVRTTAAVALGTLWAVPVGIQIGIHPRAARVLQPVVQVAASFPAPMLFPMVLSLLAALSVPLGFGSVLLMALGTQWYILFNVIAGATSIPNELHEAARVYRFTRWQRWRRVLLPAVFPALVTGWVTAAGGAWNASIVSEYVQAAGTVRHTEGLGALISIAATRADFPALTAGVLTMAIIVVLINRTFWKRLYVVAERRYSLGR